MPGLEVRTFDAPDETIPLGEKGHAEVISAGGVAVWRATCEPGWRYVGHVDEGSCPAPHAAYVVSGRLRIAMEDGTEAEAGPGEIMVIEPGHDAWTVGDEPCVFVDFGESVVSDRDRGAREEAGTPGS